MDKTELIKKLKEQIIRADEIIHELEYKIGGEDRSYSYFIDEPDVKKLIIEIDKIIGTTHKCDECMNTFEDNQGAYKPDSNDDVWLCDDCLGQLE